jgi:hypothetical protein
LNLTSNKWGIELQGLEIDKELWRSFLKPPFDPFVEEVKCEQGNYLALRSAAFDEITNSDEIHRVAESLFIRLNVAMSNSADTDPVSNGSVVEFVTDGQPRRHNYAKGMSSSRGRATAFAKAIFRDAQGNPINRPLTPHRAQLWMRAATLDPKIASAMLCLQGKPSWVELFKAYEAVETRAKVGISKNEIARFTQTANAEERHLKGKFESNKRPMELWEARSLITQLVSTAIDEILAKNP